jgi:hypothetical protein
MRLRAPSSTVIIWLAASVLAALSCSLYFYATYFHGEYVPLGNDGFYHARRILDTVADPSAFYQFDPRIHAPEGSLLVWPWGYDYLMAQLVRLGLAIGLSHDPMAILVRIPVAAVFVSMGLLVVAMRQLSMPAWAMTLAALCLALAPTTQFLHGAGQIDHHYAEFMFILAALAAGLAWLRIPENPRYAALTAATLGAAPCIHNGLFILQLPLLATLFVHWLQGQAPPRKAMLTFAAVLAATTCIVLLPSTAFRTGRFEFYTLSWFHLYIATCTALICVLIGLLPHTRRNVALFVVTGALLALPILAQIKMAQAFVAGTFKWLETIAEMKSPVREALTGAGWTVARIYSFLFWIAPLTWLLCLYRCWRDRRSQRLLFWITAALGLSLLAMQVRLHYFGDFALYLPWLLLAGDLTARRPELTKKTCLAASLALLVSYSPALRQLVAPVSPANDTTFEDTRSLYSALQKACAEDPGIVLADNNAGHYIRYYTDCSVMVNNFLLTPLHFRKMDEVEHLFALSAEELIKAAPEVKYVLVRPLDIRRADDPKDGYRYWFFFPGTPRLATDLLLAARESVPKDYELLHEIRFREADNIPYARLYKIHRSQLPAQTRVGE